MVKGRTSVDAPAGFGWYWVAVSLLLVAGGSVAVIGGAIFLLSLITCDSMRMAFPCDSTGEAGAFWLPFGSLALAVAIAAVGGVRAHRRRNQRLAKALLLSALATLALGMVVAAGIYLGAH